jgi:hypothetical protein
MTSLSVAETAAPRVTALLASVLERCETPAEVGGETRKVITLGELIDALDERAFGLGLLLLALPCAIPFLYGIPQIVSLPMLALAAQLAMGREHPWLPKRLAGRQIKIAGLRNVVRRTQRSLGFLERLAGNRLVVLTDGVGARITGALLLIPIASILMPFPMTNTTPGIGVAIAAVGLLERDGLLTLAGLLLGLVWVAVLVFFGAEALSALKALILG